MDRSTAEGGGTTGAGDNQAGPGREKNQPEWTVPPREGTEGARDQGGTVT